MLASEKKAIKESIARSVARTLEGFGVTGATVTIRHTHPSTSVLVVVRDDAHGPTLFEVNVKETI